MHAQVAEAPPRHRRTARAAARGTLRAPPRQAGGGGADALADAEDREDLNRASGERQTLAANQTALLVEMVQQNTQLTETIKSLTERVEALTREVHLNICANTAG